ncbi:PucR family transcriptional regulator [Sporolactobacillus nakayamae]|uniref:Purine catabolism regulatory protein n=1 Tax=Sporolactobacillus nakayamae TaxID=269670 RepID=A0A1I2QZR1_9BACL|nr:PucR family transcriptional regulator [Sporolactobacillus nakayamae]SFG33530.1 purine catabolism regulatory protein [Sporolactobacillus nakayamae]
MTEKLTIAKILERPYFKQAKVYADARALERIVEWAHVLEVEDVGNLLNGNELILTTGLTWKGSEAKCLKFLREIINKNAAGLVIDMGRVVKVIPERMIELAQKENFPLILIFSEIRYIDVTHDIHTYIINQQKKVVEDLEHFSSQLNQLLLMGEGIFSLLNLFFKFTGQAVAYSPVKGRMICAPHSGYFKSDEERVDEKAGNHKFCFPVLVMNQSFGQLVTAPCAKENHFTSLALDRCATAVAQEILRSMYWEEKQLNRENQWIAQWVDGQLSEKEIKERLAKIKPNLLFQWCGILIIESRNDAFDDPPALLLHQNMMLRMVFSHESFFILPLNRANRFIIIILNLNHSRSDQMIDRAIIKAMHAYKHYINDDQLIWGVSGKTQPLNGIHQSVLEAIEVIDVQSHIGLLKDPFHHSLHIYQVINHLNKNDRLLPFIREQIGNLEVTRNERTVDLLHTLKIYLECGGSKKEAAAKLFISRQSLYKRLAQINERLGGDIEQPRRRLSIELALVGLDYLNKTRP